MTEPSAHLLGEIGLDPSWSHTINVPSHDGQSHRWHYLERAGTSDSAPTILCLHGNPTWSFLWSRLINEISDEYRVVAPDHLSMGYSDQIGTRRYRDRVLDVHDFVSALGIEGPSWLVAQDWGGAIGSTNFSFGVLDVFNADALDFDMRGQLTGPVRVVANLPYNVGTELLVRWLTPKDWPPFWSSLTLMFQKEVAERIIAKPGTKAYGRLGILAQWKSTPSVVMELPPEAFTPPPKVHSAVVHLEALAQPRFPAPAGLLSSTVAMAFNQRRKMLRSSLKSAAPDIETALRDAGLEPTARAEEISLEGFCALARRLAK